MEGNRVYLAACPDYGQAEAKLREAVAALGGMERFVRPGERILLKANLLRAAPPESAICTHPAVAAAAAKLVAEAGGTAVITDSPGGALHKEAVLRGLYEKTGMAQAAAASGAELCYDASTRTVSLPAGRVLKQAEVIAPVAEADGVFDLPKLKTHVLMSMTGAVKNLFGVLPGLSKVGYHATHPSQEQFADVLLDLAEYVRPRLSIMDGVLAMEGDGPGASGTPRHAGVLLVSDSPLALDAAAAALIGLPLASNPVLLAAQRRGLRPSYIEEVELLGEPLEALRMDDYRFPSRIKGNLMEFLGPLAGPAGKLCKRVLSQTPKIRTDACVGCGICKSACPGKAISMDGPGGKARIDPQGLHPLLLLPRTLPPEGRGPPAELAGPLFEIKWFCMIFFSPEILVTVSQCEEAVQPMILDKIALILAIIGGLNWGSIGLFQFDFVAALFGGQDSAFSRVIFALVGLAALWCISLLFRDTHGKE